MKQRFLATLAVSALFLSIAMPAGANTGNIGSFTGAFTVGKSTTACGNDGRAIIDEGFGWPTNKDAFYQLETTLNDSEEGPGTLNVCGHVHPPNAKTGIGAPCGSSSGDHGKGRIVFENETVLWLNNVGWDDAVGGVLPIFGDVSTSTKGTAKAQLKGLLLWSSTYAACPPDKDYNKQGSGSGDVPSYSVWGVYATD